MGRAYFVFFGRGTYFVFFGRGGVPSCHRAFFLEACGIIFCKEGHRRRGYLEDHGTLSTRVLIR